MLIRHIGECPNEYINPRVTSFHTDLSERQCCGSGSGMRCLFDPGSGMGKKSRSGSGMNIPDHISESLETFLGYNRVLKFFEADADPGIF
jgi:hypothetical protein